MTIEQFEIDTPEKEYDWRDYSRNEKENIKKYIDSVEDRTVLSETELVIYNHFKEMCPKLDWILKKRVHTELLDLVNEGTFRWCEYEGYIHGVHDDGVNNMSPYHDYPMFIVGYQDNLVEIYEEEFGFEDDIIESYHESYTGITKLEDDFFNELYNYSEEIVITFWTIMEKECSKHLSELLDKLYERRLLIVPKDFLDQPSGPQNITTCEIYNIEKWNGGEFTHPKLQRNFCRGYVRKVSVTVVPLTERLVERHKNNELFLDIEKIDFGNISPVFSKRQN